MFTFFFFFFFFLCVHHLRYQRNISPTPHLYFVCDSQSTSPQWILTLPCPSTWQQVIIVSIIIQAFMSNLRCSELLEGLFKHTPKKGIFDPSTTRVSISYFCFSFSLFIHRIYKHVPCLQIYYRTLDCAAS